MATFTLSSLHIPLLTLITGAAGAGATYAALKSDVAALKDQHAETRARVEKLEPAVQQQGTDIAVIKQIVVDMKQGVDRLEDKMGTKP